MKNKNSREGFKHLNLEDRIQIEIQYSQGKSFSDIAKILGRDKSAISREINGKPHKGRGRYKAYQANIKALERDKNRGKRERLKNEIVRNYVKDKLKLGWSPEQISLRLPIEHPGETISYEAIYQFVYAQINRGGNGTVKENCEDLRIYLPRRHTRRQTKGFRKARKIERNNALPSIENRPVEVDLRQEIGHWEDDCLVSRCNTVRLKTINERATGIVLIDKLKDGSINESNRAVCERLQTMPAEYRKTLTRDRGTENMGYEEVEKELSLSCYFAHSYCSQERGSNENLNGLIRRFLPKKTDFAKVGYEEIHRIEYLLNTRPRKRFGGKTPLEVLLEKTGVAITY